MRFDLEAEVAGYIEAQHWTGLYYPAGDGGEEPSPLDENDHSSFNKIPAYLCLQMRREMKQFLEILEWGLSEEELDFLEEILPTPGHIGHNFSLTKNHHGTGFWDRGLGGLGDKVTDLCQTFSEGGLYKFGDDWELE